jgi:hypothetical protein
MVILVKNYLNCLLYYYCILVYFLSSIMNVDKKSVVFYHLTNKYTVCYSIPHLVRVPLKLRVTNEGMKDHHSKLKILFQKTSIESLNMTTTRLHNTHNTQQQQQQLLLLYNYNYNFKHSTTKSIRIGIAGITRYISLLRFILQ